MSNRVLRVLDEVDRAFQENNFSSQEEARLREEFALAVKNSGLSSAEIKDLIRPRLIQTIQDTRKFLYELHGFTLFKKGDRVRFKKAILSAFRTSPFLGGQYLSSDEYVVGAVVDLPSPEGLWSNQGRDLTYLEMIGHPQWVFLEGIEDPLGDGFLPGTADPEQKRRKAISGSWLILVHAEESPDDPPVFFMMDRVDED